MFQISILVKVKGGYPLSAKIFCFSKIKKKKKGKGAVHEANLLSEFSCSFMSDLIFIQDLYTIRYSVFYNIELGSSLGLDT